MRRAKIVCTLGPASSSPEKIGELIDAGMDVARLNFSHGEHEDHAKTLQAVRSEAHKRGNAVAVLLDLQGPKIRVGRFATGSRRAGRPAPSSRSPPTIGARRRAPRVDHLPGLPGT